MDKLSDVLGRLIPGSSRWPPRHPAKVSLVMALLGILSGWATMAGGTALNLMYGSAPHRAVLIFLAAGPMLAIFVVIPWAWWLGTRFRWLWLLPPYCFVGNLACYVLIEIFPKNQPALLFFLFGLVTGLYLAVAAICLSPRRALWWMVGIMIVSGIGASLNALVVGNHSLEQFLPRQILLPLVIGWFFSTIHVSPALCLGYLLWDRTPLQKSLPEHDDGSS
jgi:hypothetical protein